MFHPVFIVSFLQNKKDLVYNRETSRKLVSTKRWGILTVKSSRACAPLLSFLASAECMVIQAFIKRFSNSMVSIKSEFLSKDFRISSQNHVNTNKKRESMFLYTKLHHIKLWSFTWTSWKLSHVLSINWQPAKKHKFKRWLSRQLGIQEVLIIAFLAKTWRKTRGHLVWAWWVLDQ